MIREKKIQVQLTTKEPLRIGGKKDPLSGADNPVTRVGGKLVIPGSSLKGALRSEVEKFLIDSYYENRKWKAGFEHFKPCIPADELSVDETQLVNAGKYRDQGGNCRYPCTDKKCRKIDHSICPACYLFGSMGLNGFVKVPFLYADASATELYSSRIDRATRTIAHGTNRPYELVPDGAIFKGILYIVLEDTVLNWKLGEPRNLGEARTLGDKWLEGKKIDEKTQEEFIKTYIVDRLKAIKVLGGYKSKGFGAVEITVL
jgi:CRISPR/Cas system CSM-associated protein Csm3 (group 7 of RAMP superfamily)